MNKNQDLLKIAVLLLISVIAVYFIPASKTIFLLFTLVLFFNSNPKHDYFWVFFVLLIIDNPGSLFLQLTDKVIKLGPIIFSFLQLFFITAVIKIVFKSKRYKGIRIFFAKTSRPYFFWLTFLLIEGLFIGIEGGGSTGYRHYYYYALTFVIFPVFFVMPYLIKDYSDVRNLYKLMALFVFFNFISQIYNIIFGMSLHTALGGANLVDIEDVNAVEDIEGLVRPVYFVFSIFFTFILSSFFLYVKEKELNRTFLYFALVISLFSIIITATRGWILAFLIYLILLIIIDMFYTKKHIPQKIIASLVIVTSFLFLFVPVIERQILKSINRVETVSLIFEGDVTANGTNSRLTTRLYPVLEKFNERPIVGWGFSKTGMEAYDGHVGFLSPLMIGGVVGAVILIMFILSVIRKYYRLYKYLPSQNPLKKGTLVLISSFIILLVVHFTSAQVFGYYRYISDRGSGALLVALFLSILNAIYYSALNENRR